MKKILTIAISALVVVTAGYLFLRFSVLKSKDFKADHSKARSVVDLRPQLIAKLQQMVKDASDGLYKLAIGDIRVLVSPGGLSITNLTLTPDTAILKQLADKDKTPEDVYRIRVVSAYLDGIGLADLL